MTQQADVRDDIDVLYVGFVLGHGGDAVQMLDLAAEVAARGLRVRIVVPDLPTTRIFAERVADLGLDCVRSPWVRADARGARQNVIHLLRLFRENRAKLYHLHTGDVCLPRLVLLAMSLLDVRPVIVTIQSPYETIKPGDARARYWAHSAASQLCRVICPSEHSYNTQLAYGLPPETLKVIHNSVNIGRFANGEPKNAREALQLDSSRKLIVFSSRLEAQKRPQDAVRAFNTVAGAYPDADLVFVGEGSLEAETDLLVESLGLAGRVHFAGYRQNVEDWLAAADVWILPTESENFSLAVLEALAAGCVVVSTVCPGNDEILVHLENSLLSQVGDTAAMGKNLDLALSDRRLAERLQSAARETARGYSLEAMVNHYAECYNESLGVPGGGNETEVHVLSAAVPANAAGGGEHADSTNE